MDVTKQVRADRMSLFSFLQGATSGAEQLRALAADLPSVFDCYLSAAEAPLDTLGGELTSLFVGTPVRYLYVWYV